MPAIYGNDFGDLSRNVQSQAALRQQALASALNTAVSALNAARSHQTELQRLSQQKSQFGEEMEFRKSQEEERKTEANRNYEMAKKGADLNERYFDVYKDATEAKKGMMTPAQQREHDATLNQADSDAAEGTFDDAAHVQKLYPNLSPSEAQVLANRSLDARRQVTADYVTANNAANVLNKHQELTQRIYSIDRATKELQSVKNTMMSGGNSEQVIAAQNQLSRLAQMKERASRSMMQIEPIAQALNKDKNVNNLLTFDPASERFVPTVATPRWMKQAVANAPEEAPANQEAAPDEFQAPPTRTANSGASSKPAKTSTTTDQGPPEPTVKVRGRDGSIYNIPQSKVRVALARGGTLVATPTVVQPSASGSAMHMVESGFLH